jgi:hypothetical protein
VEYSRFDICILLFPCLFFVQQSVHLNVVSGLTLSETAGDLAIAAAICSRFIYIFFFMASVL